MDLNDQAFSISVVGNFTGETFKGNFRAKKRLSHLDRLRKDQYRRELLGGTAPDQAGQVALDIATIVSELRVRLVDAPKWWLESEGGLQLEDINTLMLVFEGATKIETDAAEALKKSAAVVADEMKAEQGKKE
jgi:hypothetical protein